MVKNLKIEARLHEQMKEYCDTQGLKMGKLAERIISSYLTQQGEQDEDNRNIRDSK
jgi:hypothetical protein